MTNWDRLVRAHGAAVFGTAWRILGHAADTEEVVQEVFLEAYQLRQTQPVKNWAGLLRRLAACRALDRLRQRMPSPQLSQAQLRARSWWSGPDIYVVADDYDLVATPAGNPLSAMLEYLPYARDLGLHLVVARRSGGAARALFEPLLAGLRDLGCVGLVMSGRPDEGALLGSVRPAPQPPGRGVLVTREIGRAHV